MQIASTGLNVGHIEQRKMVKDTLKLGLRQVLERQLSKHRKAESQLQKAVVDLEGTNLSNANYLVVLRPLGLDAKKGIEIGYTGKLEEAIKTAEENFKKLNQRNDVHASYKVYIVLAGQNFPLPQQYWEQFAEDVVPLKDLQKYSKTC